MGTWLRRCSWYVFIYPSTRRTGEPYSLVNCFSAPFSALLSQTRSWGSKASPLTARDGTRVRRRGAAGRRVVSWNINDDYRHEYDARRVAVTTARPSRLNATGGGDSEARVSWNLVDFIDDAGTGGARHRAPRRERLNSLLSDISESINDSRQRELVDMLYDELGGMAASRKPPAPDLPPTSPSGEGNGRRFAGVDGSDGPREMPPVPPFRVGKKPLSSSFSSAASGASAASGGENGVVDPLWIPPFRGGKLPPSLEAETDDNDKTSGTPRDAADQCDSPGGGEEGKEEAEELVSYSFDHNRSGRPHGFSGLTTSAVSQSSLLSSIASAEGLFDVGITSAVKDDEGEKNLAELHRRLSISSPGGCTAATSLSVEDERQQRLLESMMQMADRRNSGQVNGSSGGDDPSETGFGSRPSVDEQNSKGTACGIDNNLPGGTGSGQIQSLLQGDRKQPANGELDPLAGRVDSGPSEGEIAALAPPESGAALSAPRIAAVSATGPDGAASLAHHEVEDYRTRLRRKRDSMASAYDYEEDRGENQEERGNEDGDGSPLLSRERLNEMLLENATSISNSLLLQRALIVLGQGNDGGNVAGRRGAALGRSFAGGGGRATGMSDGGVGEETETPEQRKARFKRANSHDTGLGKCIRKTLLDRQKWPPHTLS